MLVGSVPSVIRSDQGGELSGMKMRLFCREKRIRQEFSAPGTSWQNPRAEAAIGSISVRARALLAHAGMPAGYWEYAVQTSVAILNSWTPTSRHSNMTAH
eukprot:1914650-Rhodomonas_salina.1